MVTKVTGAWPKADGVTLEEVDGTIGVKEIPSNKLKTAIGESSGSISSDYTAELTLNDFCFFPAMIANVQGPFKLCCKYGTSAPSDPIVRFAIHNTSASTHNYWLKWRYIIASEPRVVFIVKDCVWVSEPVRDEKGEIICPLVLIDKEGDAYYAKGFYLPKELQDKPTGYIIELFKRKKLDESVLDKPIKAKVERI